MENYQGGHKKIENEKSLEKANIISELNEPLHVRNSSIDGGKNYKLIEESQQIFSFSSSDFNEKSQHESYSSFEGSDNDNNVKLNEKNENLHQESEKNSNALNLDEVDEKFANPDELKKKLNDICQSLGFKVIKNSGKTNIENLYLLCEFGGRKKDCYVTGKRYKESKKIGNLIKKKKINWFWFLFRLHFQTLFFIKKDKQSLCIS